MKQLLITAILAMGVFAGCSSSNASRKPLTVASDTASVKYQCPMKCQGDTAYTTVGLCPICEMDLRKK